MVVGLGLSRRDHFGSVVLYLVRIFPHLPVEVARIIALWATDQFGALPPALDFSWQTWTSLRPSPGEYGHRTPWVAQRVWRRRRPGDGPGVPRSWGYLQ